MVFILIAALAWIFLEPPISFTMLSEFAPARGAQAWMNYWPVGVAAAWAIVLERHEVRSRGRELHLGAQEIRKIVDLPDWRGELRRGARRGNEHEHA